MPIANIDHDKVRDVFHAEIDNRDFFVQSTNGFDENLVVQGSLLAKTKQLLHTLWHIPMVVNLDTPCYAYLHRIPITFIQRL